jgi:hypothetical protein
VIVITEALTAITDPNEKIEAQLYGIGSIQHDSSHVVRLVFCRVVYARLTAGRVGARMVPIDRFKGLFGVAAEEFSGSL